MSVRHSLRLDQFQAPSFIRQSPLSINGRPFEIWCCLNVKWMPLNLSWAPSFANSLHSLFFIFFFIFDGPKAQIAPKTMHTFVVCLCGLWFLLLWEIWTIQTQMWTANSGNCRELWVGSIWFYCNPQLKRTIIIFIEQWWASKGAYDVFFSHSLLSWYHTVCEFSFLEFIFLASSGFTSTLDVIFLWSGIILLVFFFQQSLDSFDMCGRLFSSSSEW